MTRQQQLGYALVLVGVLTGIIWAISQFILPILPPNLNSSVILVFAVLLSVLGGLAAFKDTVELIHILSGQNQRSAQQSQPVFKTVFNQKVDANVIITGGQNVTINIPQQEPINNRIAYAESSQEIFELFQKLLGENVQRNFLWEKKHEAYSQTWHILQVVRVAGDALWERVSKKNILTFTNALQDAKTCVNYDAIFFDKDDFNELLKLLEMFGDFRVGKQRLYQIRSIADIDKQNYAVSEIKRQVNQNRIIRAEYENLLNQIMESFRLRLSR